MQTGGPEGNARLTALTGVALMVLLAIEGITLISLRSMLSWHIFVGLLLVPVVALKLGSTGYKIYRYYTRRADYVEAGPPHLLLRLLGPVVAASTIALLATGILLIAKRPGDGLAHLAEGSLGCLGVDLPVSREQGIAVAVVGLSLRTAASTSVSFGTLPARPGGRAVAGGAAGQWPEGWPGSQSRSQSPEFRTS